MSNSAHRLKQALTNAAVTEALNAARARSAALSTPVSIAIVDDGGLLMGFERSQAVHPATVDVSIAKAKSAALFRRPTAALAEGLAKGATYMLALPGVMPVPGGVPLAIAGEICGAIGISGGTPDVDQQIAQAGAEALAKL